MLAIEQFDTEEIEDYEMRNPSEVNGTEIPQDDNVLILKYEEGSDTEMDEMAESTWREPAHSGTNFLTVTPLYSCVLPSTVDSQIAPNHYPALLTDDDPFSAGSLPSEPCPWTFQTDNRHPKGQHLGGQLLFTDCFLPVRTQLSCIANSLCPY